MEKWKRERAWQTINKKKRYLKNVLRESVLRVEISIWVSSLSGFDTLRSFSEARITSSSSPLRNIFFELSERFTF